MHTSCHMIYHIFPLCCPYPNKHHFPHFFSQKHCLLDEKIMQNDIKLVFITKSTSIVHQINTNNYIRSYVIGTNIHQYMLTLIMIPLIQNEPLCISHTDIFTLSPGQVISKIIPQLFAF